MIGADTAPGVRRNVSALVLLAVTVWLSWAFVACTTNTPAAPTANAGPDLTVFAGFPAVLDGAGSKGNGAEARSLAYRWELVARPAGSKAELAGSDTPTPKLQTDQPGDYALLLTVRDGERWSEPDTATVTARQWLSNVTREAGVLGGGPRRVSFSEGEGPGASFADYDGDGDPDLYVTSDGYSGMPAPAMLYRNSGDGTFAEVAKDAGVAAMCNSYGAAWGDYDRDRDLDMYLACHSPDSRNLENRPTEPNILYRNNGNGTFTDVAREAGVAHVAHGTTPAWVDYDRDGDLDLYVANFGIHGQMVMEGVGEPNVLYRNNGDGTFTDVTEAAGVAGATGRFARFRVSGQFAPRGMTFASLWFDFDNDGDPDLLECNDEGVSPLYRNNGDGTFTDVTKAAGLYRYGSCMGIDAGDYNRDGFLDFYWTNFGENYLWHNNGDGTFSEVAARAGVADKMVGWATAFIDIDNDGWLDLFAVNGLVGPVMERLGRPWKQPDVLYRNNRDGTFTDVSKASGFDDASVGRGAAVADFDGDGDLDIYLVNADAANVLYRNDIGTTNGWIRLRFSGSTSNLEGFGVRAVVETEDGRQIGEVRSGAGSGFLGGGPPELHFGVGHARLVKRLSVTWPSGLTQTLTDLAPNQTITVTEAAGGR